MKFYVEGLPKNLRTIVARFHQYEFCQDMTFERLIQLAKDKGIVAR